MTKSQLIDGLPEYPELSTFELFEMWVSKESRFEVVLSEKEQLEQVQADPATLFGSVQAQQRDGAGGLG